MTMCLVFDMNCPYFDNLTCMCTLENPIEECDDYAVYANENDETSEEWGLSFFCGGPGAFWHFIQKIILSLCIFPIAFSLYICYN